MHETKKAFLEMGARLGEEVPMRRGSLSERYVKCSKPGCGCANDPKLRHGPYYSLTRSVGGKTRSRFLSKEQAERVREQIEAGQRFRKRIEEYWRAAEAWADAELELTEGRTADDAGKKNGCGRASTRNSSRRSRN